MTNQNIYWTSIEYKYCGPEVLKLEGGFVYGFVKASDEREALNKFTTKLKHQDVEVQNVEFISLYDLKTEWENQEQTNIFVQLYQKAKKSSEVVFHTFYVYETD